MVHLVEDPTGMLNEIERVLLPEGFLYIADLRRSWLGLVKEEIRSASTPIEARKLPVSSELRQGAFSSGLLWWRFEA
jgi:ubiquinone/menaquinone biosynthesis C-methylase UbiE